MKVLVHPADDGACGRYRLRWPAEALIAQGHDVHLRPDHTYYSDAVETHFGYEILGLRDAVDADVVVIQRPLSRERFNLVKAIQAQGVAVVVEIDDDFHSIHMRNPAWKASNPLHDPEMNRDWLMRSCERADLVTVTTPALAQRYGGHGRVAVLPNFAPESYTKIVRPEHDDLVVGWSGSVATHPDDLQATGGVLQGVLDAAGARFEVVGTGVGVAKALGFHVEPRATGWVGIEDYPYAMAGFDVGIVPLAPREFNDAKSCLKGLEMAALGVPFVASPAADYRRLARAGLGFLAPTATEWTGHLVELLGDAARFRDYSSTWRAEVVEHYTIEANAWRWLEAWERATRKRAVA